jgi:hypothetical protein
LPQIGLPRFPDQCLSELIVLFRGDELESGPLVDAADSVRTHFAARALSNPHPRASTTVRRALVSRLDRLSEEEIKRLTTREIFAYFKLIDRVDSRADIRRMVEGTKWKHK